MRSSGVAAAGLAAIVLEMLHETSEAQQRYETAQSIFTQVGARGNAADALAGLARCALALGNRVLIEQYAAQLGLHLRQSGTQGMEFPLWAYLTCAQAHAALDERDQVRKMVAAGYSDLITRAEKISRVEWGRSYLSNVPEHRALLDLWEQITLTA